MKNSNNEVLKQKKELHTLNSVFSESEYRIVEQGKQGRPDFVVIRDKTAAFIGVEVTDGSESDFHSSVRNADGKFRGRLLGGTQKSPNPKEVRTVSILAMPVSHALSDDELVELMKTAPVPEKPNAIMMRVPTAAEHTAKIIERIRDKDTKTYDTTGLQRFDLIVHDYFSWQFSSKVTPTGETAILADEFFTPELIATLATSDFSEIYLTTEGTRQYRRLRVMFAFSEAQRFSEFLKKRPENSISNQEKIALFAHCMKKLHNVEVGTSITGNPRSVKADETAMFTYRGYVMELTHENGKNVTAHFVTDATKLVPNKVLDSKLLTNFLQSYVPYRKITPSYISFYAEWGDQHFQ